MRIRLKVVLPFIVCGFLLMLSVVTTAKSDSKVFRIYVEVDGDPNITSLITSYITRELRSIGDIVVVDSKPEYKLIIAAVETKTTGGEKLGFSLAIVILEYYPEDIYSYMLKEEDKDSFRSIMADICFFKRLLVMSGPYRSLRSICSEIVAEFDNEYLEPSRKLSQRIKDSYSK